MHGILKKTTATLNSIFCSTRYLLNEIPTKYKLVNKLLNVLRIFISAQSSEDNNKFAGISIAIVLFVTASEALYLKREDAKRNTLQAVFASIYDGTDFSSEEIVDKMPYLLNILHGLHEVYA
ncbi:hypothetical protein [Lysinibacillus xylanilyticus]|uniref:hypothetical protein n=1 Tax=Lysinibacillus xylanilyticus TaxID=582475 RepID=UPI003D027925